jgi:hypothetical protein
VPSAVQVKTCVESPLHIVDSSVQMQCAPEPLAFGAQPFEQLVIVFALPSGGQLTSVVPLQLWAFGTQPLQRATVLPESIPQPFAQGIIVAVGSTPLPSGKQIVCAEP